MSKIHWKNQYKRLPNQSDAHEKVRKILCNDPVFSKLCCYQEVPVSDVCPGYTSTQQRFDWYIQELGVVLEIHGEQHYSPTAWSKNTPYLQKMLAFHRGRARDSMKKQAAEEAGLRYLEIPYSKIRELDGPKLLRLLEEA